MTLRARSPRVAAPRPAERRLHLALALWGAVPLGQMSEESYAKILGKDDALFARELSRQGYPDLAEDVLKAIEAAGGTGGESGARADMLRIDLEQDEAMREMDPLQRVNKMEQLVRSREEFAQAHAGTPEAIEIQQGQLELYRSVGELITQVLQEGTSPDAEALRERGIEILTTAKSELSDRRDALAAEADGEPEPTPERMEELRLEQMFTSYGLARTQYFRALLYPPDSTERTLILREALRILLDFQLEYPEEILCFEGFIYEGLCHKAQGDLEAAVDSLDAAIKLREYYEQDRGVYKLDEAAADVVSSAVLQKMLLLSERGDHAGAVAVAEDYQRTTPNPWQAFKGLAVLAEQAAAYQALGDDELLTATAKTLIEVDPLGPGGRRGRELLGQGGAGALGAKEVMRLAESSIANEPDRAIELFQQAMLLARGTPDRDEIGARAGSWLGYLYSQRGLLHEAAVAYDTTAERFPKGKDAPECLWRAINTYLVLQGQERRSIYKDLAQTRLEELTKRYPEHPRAASAALIEGQQAEADQDYRRAADVYERIPKGSAAYEEGVYKAANAWANLARKALDEGQAAEGKQAVEHSEKLYVRAREELTAAAGATLEISAQDRLRGLAFSARVGLANLYLLDGVDRAADVLPLFQGAEQELSADPARMSTVWELRFRALSEQKKLDEAMALFDAQVKQNPGATWLAGGARLLAPILDARGTELRKADPQSAEADRIWRKAASNYLLAVKGQLEGREAVQLESLEGVADRLFIFALHFEGLPDTVDSFVDYDGEPLSSDLLEATVRAYEMLVPLTPSYRTAIKLARTLGFLGRWEETAARYSELFERENFADRATKTINQEVRGSKPELLFAYIEWGVSERLVGVERGDKSRLVRASEIFEALVRGTFQASKLWWQAKYYQLQTYVDRGEYEVADVAIKSLKLSWERFDEGQYGLEERFKKLEEELSKKVFQ